MIDSIDQHFPKHPPFGSPGIEFLVTSEMVVLRPTASSGRAGHKHTSSDCSCSSGACAEGKCGCGSGTGECCRDADAEETAMLDE